MRRPYKDPPYLKVSYSDGNTASQLDPQELDRLIENIEKGQVVDCYTAVTGDPEFGPTYPVWIVHKHISSVLLVDEKACKTNYEIEVEKYNKWCDDEGQSWERIEIGEGE